MYRGGRFGQVHGLPRPPGKKQLPRLVFHPGFEKLATASAVNRQEKAANCEDARVWATEVADRGTLADVGPSSPDTVF